MKGICKLFIMVMCIVLVGCSNKTISETEAKEIALKDAQVEEKDVIFLEKEVDDDEYKFVFQSSTMQYEYEIDRKNGEIESQKSEVINNSSSFDNTQTASQIISQDEAKQIAFEQFQVNESDIYDLEIEFDNDNIPHYEIEFKVNLKEYSVKINAQTKEILEKKIDF